MKMEWQSEECMKVILLLWGHRMVFSYKTKCVSLMLCSVLPGYRPICHIIVMSVIDNHNIVVLMYKHVQT